MFREMRRFKQQLSEEACKEILEKEPRGVLSVLGDDDYPYGIPMDYIYDKNENKIYFHCTKEGHKIDAINKHNKVSLCVFDKGVKKDGDWALYIQSVVVFGKIKLITDYKETVDKVRYLAMKYYPDAESVEEEMKLAIDRVQLLELSIEHMTGKLVHEK